MNIAMHVSLVPLVAVGSTAFASYIAGYHAAKRRTIKAQQANTIALLRAAYSDGYADGVYIATHVPAIDTPTHAGPI